MKNKIIIVIAIAILIILGVGISFYGEFNQKNESSQKNEKSSISENTKETKTKVYKDQSTDLKEEEIKSIEESEGRKLTKEEISEINEKLRTGEIEKIDNSTEENTLIYENTIKYDANSNLYMGVRVDEDTHELIGYIDYGLVKNGEEFPDKKFKESAAGKEFDEIMGYMLDVPSNKFPSETEIGIKFNNLNYNKIKECWDGLELPENIRKFEKE